MITISQPAIISKADWSKPMIKGAIFKLSHNKASVIKKGLRDSIKYSLGSSVLFASSGIGKKTELRKKQTTTKKGIRINSHIEISSISLYVRQKLQKKPKRTINKIKHQREKNHPKRLQFAIIIVFENLFKKFATASPSTIATIVAMYSKMLILERP